MDTEVSPGLEMPWLEQVCPTPVRSWRLGRERLTIRRDPNSNVVVDDPRASGHHATFIRQGLSSHLLDEASTDGIRVGGKRIRQPKKAGMPLFTESRAGAM